LLGDVAAANLAVGLVVRRCRPRTTAEVTGRREPGHVADLGHEDGREDWADARDGPDCVVAEVAAMEGSILSSSIATSRSNSSIRFRRDSTLTR